MIDSSDFKIIDGEEFITGRAMARMTLASVLGEPKGQRANQFYKGVVPLVRKANPETARAIELALAHYSGDFYRFKIRRSLSVGGPLDPLQLLDESDRVWLDSLCERIDLAIGSHELLRGMGFEPVGRDGSPLAG
jgi:hypothetical protein